MLTTPNNIRNFVITAHVDHGKSTLADRLLETTNTIPASQMRPQFLDQNPISRERGVTIKLAPIRMEYQLPESLQRIFNFKVCLFNLIDTPGHVDFSYEVSRSLAAVEGAILLVDATQGIQAQTVSYFQKARDHRLKIIPVVNKIDSPAAQIDLVTRDLVESFGFNKQEILFTSAKTGQGVSEILQALIKRVPSPSTTNREKNLKALVFDSYYDQYRGVVIFIRLFNGQLRNTNQKIYFLRHQTTAKILEIGIFKEKLTPLNQLNPGEIGYLVTDLKDIQTAKVGDTITIAPPSPSITPLPGYQDIKPMVFAQFYPVENNDFNRLKLALNKLKLNDDAIQAKSVSNRLMGLGFQIGFLGPFHLEISLERLEREFNLDLISTPPSVEYLTLNSTPQEPWVTLIILTPPQYLGPVMKIMENTRARLSNTKTYLKQTELLYEIPLQDLISGLFSRLKTASSGYASLDYQFLAYRPANIVKLQILLNRQEIDFLSRLIPQEKASEQARETVNKLKTLIPRQLFEVRIQAAINNKIIASERLSALRKDVTAKLYGGDRTRKDKLLKKQKKGKKKLKMIGQIELPKQTFLKLYH